MPYDFVGSLLLNILIIIVFFYRPRLPTTHNYEH